MERAFVRTTTRHPPPRPAEWDLSAPRFLWRSLVAMPFVEAGLSRPCPSASRPCQSRKIEIGFVTQRVTKPWIQNDISGDVINPDAYAPGGTSPFAVCLYATGNTLRLIFWGLAFFVFPLIAEKKKYYKNRPCATASKHWIFGENLHASRKSLCPLVANVTTPTLAVS